MVGRAEVTTCEPADHDGAKGLRNTVRREIRARALARRAGCVRADAPRTVNP